MRRRAWLTGLPALGATGLLSGCAALAPAPMGAALRARPPAGLPRRAWLPEVPFVPDSDTLCGPAVLAEALAHAGQAVTLQTLREQVYLPGRQGTLQADMLAAPRRHARLSVEVPPTLEALCTTVAGGSPVAVLLNLSLPVWPRWHYALVTGYDLEAGELRLHSGETAHGTWGMTPFEHTWARSGHWAFSVQRPGEWPAALDEAAALRALIGLDQAQPAPHWRVQAWRSAQQRWPARLSVQVGLAQALADDGQAAAAEQVLSRWLDTQDSAVAWNNLARLRQARGDHAGALAAAERAVERARRSEPRWLEEALATQRELSR